MDDVTGRRKRVIAGAVASVTAVGAIAALGWRNRELIGELMGERPKDGTAPSATAGTGTARDATAEGGAQPQHRSGPVPPTPDARTSELVAEGTRGAAPSVTSSATSSPSSAATKEVTARPRPFARRTEEIRVPASMDPEGDLRRTCEAVLEAAPRLIAGEVVAGEMMTLIQRAVTHGYALVGESPAHGGGRRWLHVKRRKTYEEVGRATLRVETVPPRESDVVVVHRDGMGLTARLPQDVPVQADGDYVCSARVQVSGVPLVHGAVLVIYKDGEDVHWARGREEFCDGRFEPVLDGTPPEAMADV